jgi:hypothetical protein
MLFPEEGVTSLKERIKFQIEPFSLGFLQGGISLLLSQDPPTQFG